MHPSSSSSQHIHASRIRKPSHRLRQSPDPPQRRTKLPLALSPNACTPSTTPAASTTAFLPPHIVLHPDDSNNRVFHSIARSFLSVDNCAMTIKDLAEMTVKFGLVCQNVSAASQAITTYIRTHMQRCEVQQDSPLLLKHVLSGTPDDDDLLPALHSRSGGAHCTSQPEARTTNFRRGTMVWYLSRATGAPCPFARAGIRLCEYTENGRRGSPHELAKDKKRPRDLERRADVDMQCGQKRKRLLRGCASRPDDSDSDVQPPPKVKLTLRLKPCPAKPSASPNGHREVIDITHSSSESEDSMSDDDDSDEEPQDSPPEPQPAEEEPWSLPPYPRRSISIPSYTPQVDTSCSYSFYAELPPNNYCRSTSSVPSLPPDSDDEDNFHITATYTRRLSPDRPTISNEWDHEADSEGDGETHWESPGPRSPSAPILLNNPISDIAVKQEPRDVQSILDTWDDVHSLYPTTSEPVKLEPMPCWGWDEGSSEWFPSLSDDTESPHSPGILPLAIKQEEIDFESLLAPSPASTPDSTFSLEAAEPSQHRRYSEAHVDRPLGDVIHDDNDFATIRRRSRTVPAPSFHPSSSPPQVLRLEMPPSTPQASQSSVTGSSEALQSPTLASLASLIQTMSMSSPTAVSPAALLRPPPSSSTTGVADGVVVHTCQPCTPAVHATHVEATPVYRMSLGQARLLRRVDTDFVNLTPIASFTNTSLPPPSTVANAVAITQGSADVCGLWVPLGEAQSFVQQHLSSASLLDHQRDTLRRLLDVFLSDVLFERFPPALQAFHLHRGSTSERMLNHFGPHFTSTLQAAQQSPVALQPTQLVAKSHDTLQDAWAQPQPFIPFAIPPLSMPMGLMASARQADENDDPLSPSEQEMFQALCSIPEWEQDSAVPATSEVAMDDSAIPVGEPALVSQQPVTEPEVPFVMPEEAQIEAPASSAAAHSLPGAIPEESEADPAEVITVEKPAGRPRSGSGPLRRSKRVADAISSRTRSRRRGSTKALS
ncbi:hypothetical protein HGRIS_013252 [Hohenbuehelia grisea]|uniref:GDS1 winged helix domain-containing protein n=1 Tax=Hohenbuehelia grisea TaxID=104357 RepID=A0ABR3IUU3_9AGAR